MNTHMNRPNKEKERTKQVLNVLLFIYGTTNYGCDMRHRLIRVDLNKTNRNKNHFFPCQPTDTPSIVMMHNWCERRRRYETVSWIDWIQFTRRQICEHYTWRCMADTCPVPFNVTQSKIGKLFIFDLMCGTICFSKSIFGIRFGGAKAHVDMPSDVITIFP